MKYLFFDCYGGLDVQMLASALADMADNMDFIKKTAELMPIKSEILSSRVNRCSMDAYLLHLACEISEGESISDIIEKSGLDDKIKSRLKLWYKLKSDGKPYKPESDQRELMYAAVCLSLIESLSPEHVYISEILQGNAMGAEGGELRFIPSAHTELLCKMAQLRTKQTDIAREILEPGAAALLYILDAEYLEPKMHNVIKSGYGASDNELLEIPNIARCLMAEDGEDKEAVYTDFEAIMTDIIYA